MKWIRSALLGVPLAVIAAAFLPWPQTEYPVQCNATEDCAIKINAAYANCVAGGGGNVRLHGGVLMRVSGVTGINGACGIIGVPPQFYLSGESQNCKFVPGMTGTHILQTDPSKPAFDLAITASGAVMQYITIHQDHGSDSTFTTPIAFQPAIQTAAASGGAGLRLSDITFCEVVDGLRFGNPNGVGSGLNAVSNIYGAAFGSLVRVEAAGDFTHMSNIVGQPWLLASQPNKLAYMRAHMVAYESRRSDAPYVSNVDCYSCNICVLISYAGVITNSTWGLKIGRINCDRGWSALYVNGHGVTVHVDSIFFTGAPWASNTNAVLCYLGCLVDVGTINALDVSGSVIYAFNEMDFSDITAAVVHAAHCVGSTFYAHGNGQITVYGRYTAWDCPTVSGGTGTVTIK